MQWSSMKNKMQCWLQKNRRQQILLFMCKIFSNILLSEYFIQISYKLGMYSHLSNKRRDMLIDFDFFRPSTFIDFLDFFPPSNPRLLQLCTSFFTFIPTSLFIKFRNFCTPSTFILVLMRVLHKISDIHWHSIQEKACELHW